MRQLIYFVGVSADGYIANSAGQTDIFPTSRRLLSAIFARYPETCPTHLRALHGVQDNPQRFDTVIMGAKTHAPAVEAGLTHAYPHLEQLVVTHQDFPRGEGLRFIRERPSSVVRALKRQPGRDIWLAGGAHLASQLQAEIDELHLKVYPIVIGAGIPLFRDGYEPAAWTLVGTETLPDAVLLNTHHRA